MRISTVVSRIFLEIDRHLRKTIKGSDLLLDSKGTSVIGLARGNHPQHFLRISKLYPEHHLLSLRTAKINISTVEYLAIWL